jgi:enamine deaminase RidA (YjgF/YER057c/UK114 family)
MPEEHIRLQNPTTIHPPVGYSHLAEVVRGRIVYIAGQVAMDPSGAVVGPGDASAQAEQVFRNLQAALEAVGATFGDVVKLNYFLTDIRQLPEVRAVRDRFVDTGRPPPSTAVQVGRLFRPEFLLEVDAVAALKVPL